MNCTSWQKGPNTILTEKLTIVFKADFYRLYYAVIIYIRETWVEGVHARLLFDQVDE